MAKLEFAFGLAPAKAIEWLEKKGVTDKNYREMTASEIAKSYSIARMTDLDMMQSIKDAMVQAAKDGVPYAEFKKNVLNHMQTAGWVHPDGSGGKQIIDPGTGEVFGAPRRLETIYRTNMQSAFSAGQYQTYMANIDNRPYWQYQAVGDSRTRPSHLAMSGVVLRHDDPFWTTFYPPNGYNCRCTVIAYAQRDLDRRGLSVISSNESNLVEHEQPYNRKGNTFTTKAFKAPSGQTVTTDRGFDYNAGRMNYRPDLDQYDRGLAQAFAKADMTGMEFKTSLQQLYSEFEKVKTRNGIGGKPSLEERIEIRNTLSRNLKFAAGALSKEDQALLKVDKSTIWLSDDTLIKQLDSRKGQDFDSLYDLLPDVIAQPDCIINNERGYLITRQIENELLLAVIKIIQPSHEIFLQSYRRYTNKELEKLKNTFEVLKG